MTSETERLKQQVDELLHRIETNQRIYSRFERFEMDILSCANLEQLLEKLLVGAIPYFKVNNISLSLHDHHHQWRALYDNLDLPDYHSQVHFLANRDLLNQFFGAQPAVHLGKLDKLSHRKFFPLAGDLKSFAIMPLIRNRENIGSLNFGSANASRFVPEKSSDFLLHLAYTAAVCIENAFNHAYLQRQSELDILTGINNRRFFDNQLRREVARVNRERIALSCLFIDIDYFKQINDSYGHRTGDLCLREVACHIGSYLRKSDLLARYGGEEFVVLLPGTNLAQAHRTAVRICRDIKSVVLDTANETTVKVTLSIGVSALDPQAQQSIRIDEAAASLVEKADAAMYLAKQKGRDQVHVAELPE